jgi:hypothetical protein
MIKYTIKHRELSSVVITICGICLLGGCIYNLDCLNRCNPCVGVSRMWVYKKHQYMEYFFKTVQIVYAASKQTTSTYRDYNMYWIYLLPSTQQTVGCNGFYNDMFRLTRVIVRLCSEPFSFSTIITYSSGGCWSVWSGGCPNTDMNEILKTYIEKCY